MCTKCVWRGGAPYVPPCIYGDQRVSSLLPPARVFSGQSSGH